MPTTLHHTDRHTSHLNASAVFMRCGGHFALGIRLLLSRIIRIIASVSPVLSDSLQAQSEAHFYVSATTERITLFECALRAFGALTGTGRVVRSFCVYNFSQLSAEMLP